MSSGGEGKALHPAAGSGESPSARGPPCAGEGTPAAAACLPGGGLRRVRTALGLPPAALPSSPGYLGRPSGLGLSEPVSSAARGDRTSACAPYGGCEDETIPTCSVRCGAEQAAGCRPELAVTAKRAVRAEGSGACVRRSRRGFVPTALPASLARE